MERTVSRGSEVNSGIMPRIDFKLVEVVVFRIRTNPEFLVLRRSDDDEIYPGLWQLVSGGIEKDEKAFEAAHREVIEETGIEPDSMYNTPLTNVFYFYTSDTVNVSPVFAALAGKDAQVKLSQEHSEYKWLNLDEAISLLVWPGQRDAVQKVYDYIVLKNPAQPFMEIMSMRKSEKPI